MKLGISLLNYLPGEPGGLETCFTNIIRHASSLFPEDEIVFFLHQDNKDSVPRSEPHVVVDYSFQELCRMRILEALRLKRARKIERIISQSGVEAMLYPQMSMFPIHNTMPTVLIMADIQFALIPQYFGYKCRLFRYLAHYGSMKHCNHIISSSRFTKRSIVDKFHLPPDKITVIPYGFDEETRSDGQLPPSPINGPFLFYPSSTTRHKGHAVLFKTLGRLKQAGSLSHQLVLTGKQTAYWHSELQGILTEENLEDNVIHLGYVSRELIDRLYRDADAILFPTEFEGFGIPALEAASRDKKLICSTCEIFDELGVPKHWQIDFADPSQLHDAIRRPGPTILEKEPISWKESVRQTIELLRETAER
jgi:glycosyltransferase involved in cell wall biosynthesis